jgi:hypothetical protein
VGANGGIGARPQHDAGRGQDLKGIQHGVAAEQRSFGCGAARSANPMTNGAVRPWQSQIGGSFTAGQNIGAWTLTGNLFQVNSTTDTVLTLRFFLNSFLSPINYSLAHHTMQRPPYQNPPPAHSPPLHHPVPQHVSTVPQLRSPPPPQPPSQPHSGYGYAQQGGAGQPGPSGYNIPPSFGGFINDPTTQLGYQMGKSAVGAGQAYMEQNVRPTSLPVSFSLWILRANLVSLVASSASLP